MNDSVGDDAEPDPDPVPEESPVPPPVKFAPFGCVRGKETCISTVRRELSRWIVVYPDGS